MATTLEFALNNNGYYESTAVQVNAEVFNISFKKTFPGAVCVFVAQTSGDYDNAYLFEGASFCRNKDFEIGVTGKYIKLVCTTVGDTAPTGAITEEA